MKKFKKGLKKFKRRSGAKRVKKIRISRGGYRR